MNPHATTQNELATLLEQMTPGHKAGLLHFLEDFVALTSMPYEQRLTSGSLIGQRLVSRLSADFNLETAEVIEKLKTTFNEQFSEVFPLLE